MYERWRKGRATFGRCGNRRGFHFRGSVVGCYGDCGTTLSQVKLRLGLSGERAIWRRVGNDWGGADCEDGREGGDGRVGCLLTMSTNDACAVIGVRTFRRKKRLLRVSRAVVWYFVSRSLTTRGKDAHQVASMSKGHHSQ